MKTFRSATLLNFISKPKKKQRFRAQKTSSFNTALINKYFKTFVYFKKSANIFLF